MTSSFYKDLLDTGNYNSDVSEVGPDDLENMVKGVDDMDDALFGFKPKLQDSQKSKDKSEVQSSDRPKSALKKQPNVSDFPEGDLLADISLSDDDFFDIGKSAPGDNKNRDKLSTVSKGPTQDKLMKSKKIANLFGLDEDDDKDIVTGNKRKQESAADWLGIKDSPTKTTAPAPLIEDNLELKTPKKSISDSLETQEQPKAVPSDITLPKNTISVGIDKSTVSAKKSKNDLKKQDSLKIKSTKSSEMFDLLDDKNEQPKIVENLKEKKSAIFDELFGDSTIGKKSSSRRNSVIKTPENSSKEPTALATAVDDSSIPLGQYIPSVGSARRSGIGRRRETTSAANTGIPSNLFHDDWLSPSSSKQESRKEDPKVSKNEKPSAVDVSDSLPSWLGGSVILPESKQEVKPAISVLEEKPVEKQLPEKPVQDTAKATEKSGAPVIDSGQSVDTMRNMLVNSSEQSQQTALALQRTEAQLLATLGLQSTQNNLEAVCVRQRSLLESQEKQLAQMVNKQIDRQIQVEKQLTLQQQKIQHLLQVLTANLTAPLIETIAQTGPMEDSSAEVMQKKQIVDDLEKEIHRATLENEELRMRMELMEKHYKMEFESLQVQHKREIESWEEKLTMQKELSNQLSEEFKERIARLKENEAELIAQHNERIQRLRDEKAEDLRQLMEFHKMTLEQIMVLNKMIPPPAEREEQKKPPHTREHLDISQLSDKEEELIKKETMLTVLQEKLQFQKDNLEKKVEEFEDQVQQENMKNEETARQLKQERNQLKYEQQLFNQEKKHMEEQYYEQRKHLEEMQEKIVSEQSQLAIEKLKFAEEKAKLEALAKLQGVSGSATFDVLKAKAEVHGALEAARATEMQALNEKKKLREKERALDMDRWKLKEMEEDLVARAHHLDQLMKVSEAQREAGQKALEEAKELEKRADEKLKEVERRKVELKEKENNLLKIKLDIAQEEVRLNRKREQLEHILPALSTDEALTLQPIKDVIDPKMLIMRLRAERESEAITK